MAFQVVDKKRVAQLTKLTARRAAIENMEKETFSIVDINLHHEELEKICKAHEVQINLLKEIPGCNKDKLLETCQAFTKMYNEAIQKLNELERTLSEEEEGGGLNNTVMPLTSVPTGTTSRDEIIDISNSSFQFATTHQATVGRSQVQMKMSLIKFKNFASTINLENIEEMSSRQLKSLLTKVEQMMEQLEDAFTKAFMEGTEEEQKQIEVIQLSSYSKFIKLTGEIHDELGRKAPISFRNHENQDSCSEIKLQPIQLPKFDGSPENWISFRDIFKQMVHMNRKLSGAAKLTYLKAAIVDKYSPINHYSESDEGYEDAWKAILDFYDDKRKIVDKHFNSILSTKKMTSESHEELQKVLNEFTRNTEALRRLLSKDEIFDSMIAHLVTQNLDAHTRDLWESTNSEVIPSWNALKSFLEKRRKTLCSICPTKSSCKQHEGYVKSKVHVATNSYSPEDSKCPLCCDKHRLMFCQEFNKMNITKRYQFVKEKNLCFNCLSNSHQSMNCTSKSRCKTCQKAHHSMLHFDSLIKSVRSQESSNLSSDVPPFVPHNMMKKVHQQSTHATTSVPAKAFTASCCTLLSTVLVNVIDKYGNLQSCRALLDSGSDTNFLTTQCAKKLKLDLKEACVMLTGINEKTTIIRHSAEATISSHYGPYERNLKFSVLPNITGELPGQTIDVRRFNIPNGHLLADPQFHQSSKVEILLNADVFYDVLLGEKFRLTEGPMLIHSKFGWIVGGSIKNVHKNPASTFLSCFSRSEPTEGIDEKLEKFFEAEDVNSSKPVLTEEEKYCEKIFSSTTTKDENGKFIVQLPFKQNVKPLGSNLSNSMHQFYAQESRRNKDEVYNKLYCDYMQDFIATGHMSEIHPSRGEEAHYLPHHGVLKMSSTSTKLRPVFNASSRTETGISLNDVLCVGPTIQPESIHIITRFREKKYVLTGDITKMYRQIWVHPLHRKYLRVLWRPTLNEPIRHYEMNTVTFGTSCAPFLATRVIKQIAEDNEVTFPEASSIMSNSFYVDDLLFGVDSIQQGIQLRNQIISMLAKSGMNLCKMSGNDDQLLEGLPSNIIESKKESNDVIKTLGISYDVRTDEFSYRLNQPKEGPITKTSVLSEVVSVYDPIGWIGPVVLTGKLIMKESWSNDIGWKDELPDDLKEKWENFRQKLPLVNQVRIQRHMLIENHKAVELHGFCDASINAYGAVIYARSYDHLGIIKTSIVCSKSRVAPKKQKTLARLELCGATLLAKLIKEYTSTLSIKIEDVILWCDSTIVLNWITMSPNKLQTFVGNRVAVVQDFTHMYSWRHIRGEDNPADLISRGLQPQEIAECHLWWNGPSFFNSPRSEWPKSIITVNEDDEEFTEEIKKTLTISAANNLFTYVETRFSSSQKLKRVFAYIRRFIVNVRKPVDQRQIGALTLDEINNAGSDVIKIVQQSMFPAEHDVLKRGLEQEDCQISKKSSIISLTPFMDQNGVIRVRGRIDASPELTFDQKHPIILPRCRFSTVLLRELHQKNLHPTKSTLLAIMFQRYWIIRAKETIRKVQHECMKCFRQKPLGTQQLMADLPEARVKLTTPFVNTAIDYAGYYMIKTGTTRNAPSTKAYVAMFKCMCTGAIHLDVASDLSTKAFIAVLDRFVSRRGLPAELFTDNATCFEGANNELKKIVRDMEPTVKNYCMSNSIRWKFSAPRSPSAGGIYESGIKSMKHHLNRLMERSFTFEQFTTILIKIEAILNSRPLTPMSEDPEDLRVLTPGHFLIGRSLTAMPEKDFLHTPNNRLSHWEGLQQLQQKFWNFWYNNFLHQLQTRPINFREKTNVQLGDMVLIKDDNLPPMKWLMGRIIKLFPSKDKVIRNVRIKTQHGEKERNVRYVCPLPFEDIHEAS